jgi:response regulator of citrate/malate metabolism
MKKTVYRYTPQERQLRRARYADRAKLDADIRAYQAQRERLGLPPLSYEDALEAVLSAIEEPKE